MAGSDFDLNKDLLARLDERTRALQDDMKIIKEKLDDTSDDIYNTMDKHYTKRADFEPIKKLVYGFVGFLLLSIGGMFIGLLLRSNSLPMDVSLPLNPSIIRPQPPNTNSLTH